MEDPQVTEKFPKPSSDLASWRHQLVRWSLFLCGNACYTRFFFL